MWFIKKEYNLLERKIKDLIAQYHTPGISIGITLPSNYKSINNKNITITHGFSNLELNSPINQETKYQSGSIGKMFTAAAIMILYEQKTIKLTDPILLYIPEGAKLWRPITIYHLLTHTSGIPDYNHLMLNYHLDYTHQQLINFATQMGLDFLPGDQWSYSNTGYILLGIIIQKQNF